MELGGWRHTYSWSMHEWCLLVWHEQLVRTHTILGMSILVILAWAYLFIKYIILIYFDIMIKYIILAWAYLFERIPGGGATRGGSTMGPGEGVMHPHPFQILVFFTVLTRGWPPHHILMHWPPHLQICGPALTPHPNHFHPPPLLHTSWIYAWEFNSCMTCITRIPNYSISLIMIR